MALRSMTGFGRASAIINGATGDSTVVVEVKTVNHKGLDVKLRLPRALHAHEQALTQLVRTRLERGRIDVSIDVVTASNNVVSIDAARVAAYVKAAADMATAHKEIAPTLTASDVLKLPGVLVHDEREATTDEATLLSTSSQALATALDELDQARLQEGQGILKDLELRRRNCAALVDEIAARTTTSTTEKKQKLQEKLTALLGDNADPQRLAAEAAVVADRLDVAEELARLRLHLEALDALLVKPGAGRKLDFLCQELLREANTTASKCQDAVVAQRVVDLKAEIERLREQAQNVE